MVLVCAAGLGACGDPRGAGQGLVIGIESDPQSLDPRFGVDATSSRVADLVHIALTRSDGRGGRMPELARAWHWADDRTLVADLRDDARFADATPVTADDVRATYEAVASPHIASPRRATLATLARVTAPSPTRVVMHLTHPDAAFLDATSLAIQPAARVGDRADLVLGAGPYRVDEVRRGEHVVLSANPHWYAGAPAIPRIVLRVVPDAVLRILELDAGSLQLLQESFEPELVGYLRTRPGIAVTRSPGTSVAYLALGLGDPRLRDRRVRRALALAIDRDTLVRGLLGETARAASSLLAPEHWAHADFGSPRYDPRPARRLLDRAGYPDPDGPGPAPRMRLVYKTSTQPARRRVAEAIQADLAAVGIALDVRTYEWGTLFADVRHGRFEVAAMTWVGVADPDLYRLAYHSTMIPPVGLNRGRYASRAMDRLTDRARSVLDLDARRALYRRVQRWAAHDLPAIPLWWEDRVVAATTRLRGFAPQPSGDLRGLAEATLE